MSTMSAVVASFWTASMSATVSDGRRISVWKDAPAEKLTAPKRWT